MTNTRTPWGYDVVGTLGNLMTAQEFATITGGTMSSSTDQINATLAAVSAAVRAYCGWHIAPNVECIWQGDADGKLIQLPAMGVSTVHSVTVGGENADYTWRKSGLIRLNKPAPDDWGQLVHADYDAGFDTSVLASVVSQLAVNALVAAPGVMREQAGQVSITYNQTANGVTGGIRLLSSDKLLLDPYKLPAMR